MLLEKWKNKINSFKHLQLVFKNINKHYIKNLINSSSPSSLEAIIEAKSGHIKY